MLIRPGATSLVTKHVRNCTSTTFKGAHYIIIFYYICQLVINVTGCATLLLYCPSLFYPSQATTRSSRLDHHQLLQRSSAFFCFSSCTFSVSGQTLRHAHHVMNDSERTQTRQNQNRNGTRLSRTDSLHHAESPAHSTHAGSVSRDSLFFVRPSSLLLGGPIRHPLLIHRRRCRGQHPMVGDLES
jgi:hypothetical protein